MAFFKKRFFIFFFPQRAQKNFQCNLNEIAQSEFLLCIWLVLSSEILSIKKLKSI